MGDFKTDISTASVEADKLEPFFCLNVLISLFKNETCFTINHKSLIDVILASRLHSFQQANVSETGLSDFHKIIFMFFKCQYS